MAANVLSYLVPTLISTIQETARNQGAIINLTARDQRTDAAAKGQTIQYPALPDIAAVDVTPAAAMPDAAGLTSTAKTLTLNQQKAGQFKLTGEDERGMAELGANYRSEGMNLAVASVVDAIGAYVAGLMDKGAGQAFGAAATDPFATTPNILIDAWGSLAFDKAPDSNRFAILGVNNYGSASKLTQFQKLNEAPPGTSFAQGRLGMLSNFNVMYDQYAGQLHSASAAANYLVNHGGGYTAGIDTVAIDTGTGTFAGGDVVTVAGNYLPGTTTLAKMVVKSFDGTNLVFTKPLMSAVADNAAITQIADHYSSFAGHPLATYLSVRPSAEPSEGDQAAYSQVIRDPVTGLAFRLAYYKQYHQGMWEVSAVYDAIVRRATWLRKIIS